MAALPSIRPREVVRALSKVGFERVRQVGSHVILKRQGHPYLISVPEHRRDISRGTLRKIISDAGLTVEEFVALL